MKKVLIITYYWPPSGGSGVQRWLKMSKYLHDFGWEPIIYTADGGEMPARDDSLLQDVHPDTVVIKRKVLEPYSIYKRFVGQKKNEGFGVGFLAEEKKIGLAQRIATWVRGNFFIPDARKFWIKPSISFLRKYLKENPVDAIISTGPPHSMHLIALGLAGKLSIPWVADFRDPWTTIDFYDQLMLSKRADKKHKQLERLVLERSTKVVTVSNGCAKDLIRAGGKEVSVITNGYDQTDFEHVTTELTADFTITHIGSMNKDRNPIALWTVLGELAKQEPEFKQKLRVRFIGKTDHTVLRTMRENGLADNVEQLKYMPHKEVIKKLKESQILLLPLNNTPNVKGILTGKLFEYLAAERPIFCIGPPDGDAGQVIAETDSGTTVDFADKTNMTNVVQEWFRSYKTNNLQRKSSDQVLKYSRKALAGKYAELLNNLP